MAANRAHLRRARRPPSAAYPVDVRAWGAAECRPDRRRIDAVAHRDRASSARAARGRRAQAREGRQGSLFLARRDYRAGRAGGGAGLSGEAALKLQPAAWTSRDHTFLIEELRWPNTV